MYDGCELTAGTYFSRRSPSMISLGLNGKVTDVLVTETSESIFGGASLQRDETDPALTRPYSRRPANSKKPAGPDVARGVNRSTDEGGHFVCARNARIMGALASFGFLEPSLSSSFKPRRIELQTHSAEPLD